MRIELIAFTEAGCALGRQLAQALEKEGDVAGFTPCRGQGHISLADWTALAFREADALVFIGAAGIAVRSIAPFVADKARDPAVLVGDESGRYLIPLLSGHLGGANDLARRLASLYGANPILTTATDLRGLWAVDSWAKANGCALLNPGRIKTVSSRILEGGQVRLFSDWPIGGEVPAGVSLTEDRLQADVILSLHPGPWTLSSPLLLVPRIGVLGVGCRRGVSAGALNDALTEFLAGQGLSRRCLCGLASIRLKEDEAGLAEFAQALGLPLDFFDPDTLAALPGPFTGSEFVQSVTGVDNVCERSALAASEGGRLLVPKTRFEGITLALALRPFAPSF